MLGRTYISSIDFDEKFPLVGDNLIIPKKVRDFLLSQAAEARMTFKYWVSAACENPEHSDYCYAQAFSARAFYNWLKNITLYHLEGGIPLRDIVKKLSCLWQEQRQREADILDELIYLLAGN